MRVRGRRRTMSQNTLSLGLARGRAGAHRAGAAGRRGDGRGRALLRRRRRLVRRGRLAAGGRLRLGDLFDLGDDGGSGLVDLCEDLVLERGELFVEEHLRLAVRELVRLLLLLLLLDFSLIFRRFS